MCVCVCVYSFVSPRSLHSASEPTRVTVHGARSTVKAQAAACLTQRRIHPLDTALVDRLPRTHNTPHAARPCLCPQRTSRQLQMGGPAQFWGRGGVPAWRTASEPFSRAVHSSSSAVREHRAPACSAAAAAGKPLRCRHARGAHTSVAAGPAARTRCRRGARAKGWTHCS